MDNSYSVIYDPHNRPVIIISDIRFSGRRNIKWEDVKEYVKEYVGNKYEIERFNVFRIEMLVRHASDGNLYLYDMVNIKKETSTPLEQ